MLESILGGSITLGGYLLCAACALILGIGTALCFRYRSDCSEGFALTLSLLPVVVQSVILLVNGNLGAGVAVAGTFSLVRFRSVQGSAREICALFLVMGIGLATGMGYIGVAVLLFLLVNLASLVLVRTGFGEPAPSQRELRITVPESLDYSQALEDVFGAYTLRHELVQVKTTAMGSLFKLTYRLALRDVAQEKAFLDALRCRNGNLELVCCRPGANRESL